MDRTTPPRTLRRHPTARGLKRSLLAATLVLAIASTITQPVTYRPDKHVSAAARTHPATIAPQPGHPPSVPPNPPHAVATAVAHAYARYLAGQLPAQRLPALTPQALAIARQSGPLPARLDVTQVRLTSLNRDGNSWAASYAIIDARGRQTTTAQLLLTTSGSRWVIAELVPPDLDTLITPNPPALPATGPAAARHAALAFTQSYLAYTYGHATASQLRDLTPALRATLTANPPQVPAAIRALHPRIATLALTQQAARWLANANVTDGQNTYQVNVLLDRVADRWLAITPRPAG